MSSILEVIFHGSAYDVTYCYHPPPQAASSAGKADPKTTRRDIIASHHASLTMSFTWTGCELRQCKMYSMEVHRVQNNIYTASEATLSNATDKQVLASTLQIIQSHRAVIRSRLSSYSVISIPRIS